MTFISEFEIYDEVYTLINNVATKCSVRAVRFPEVNRYSPNFDDSHIMYGVLPCNSILLGGSVSEGTDFWIWKSASDLGRTKRELFTKMLNDLEGD